MGTSLGGQAMERDARCPRTRRPRTADADSAAAKITTTGDGFTVRASRRARTGHRLRHHIHDHPGSTTRLGIEVRAGLHSGECEVRGDDLRLAGLTVHVAARIEPLAAPGEVLVSTTVKDLVAGSGIAFVDKGEHQLRAYPPPGGSTPADSTLGARRPAQRDRQGVSGCATRGGVPATTRSPVAGTTTEEASANAGSRCRYNAANWQRRWASSAVVQGEQCCLRTCRLLEAERLGHDVKTLLSTYAHAFSDDGDRVREAWCRANEQVRA